MTSSLHPFDQPVNDLLSKLLDDELDRGELCYLADQLRCSSQARQLYYDHIALHAILRWMDGGPQQKDWPERPRYSTLRSAFNAQIRHPPFWLRHPLPVPASSRPPSTPRSAISRRACRWRT